MKTRQLHYGCHVKKHGSFIHAVDEALRLQEAEGVSCIQLFGKNPRSIEQHQWSQRDAAICKDKLQQAGIRCFTHSAYVLNLAIHVSDQPEWFQKTAASLMQELIIADALGAQGVVVHFGTIKHQNKLQGYQDILTMLNTITPIWNGSARILLENQAGMHGGLGIMFEELTNIRKLCMHPEKIGFCFDTCHAYVSGLWRADEAGGTAELLKSGAEHGFWPHVELIHLNDTLEAAGSKKDRHARFGTGIISQAAFKELLTSEELLHKPMILETEPIGPQLHADEWEQLRSLLNEK